MQVSKAGLRVCDLSFTLSVCRAPAADATFGLLIKRLCFHIQIRNGWSDFTACWKINAEFIFGVVISIYTLHRKVSDHFTAGEWPN